LWQQEPDTSTGLSPPKVTWTEVALVMADSRCESVVLGLLPSAFERAEIAGALGPSGSPGREQR
jgi:hypothetical protein